MTKHQLLPSDLKPYKHALTVRAFQNNGWISPRFCRALSATGAIPNDHTLKTEPAGLRRIRLRTLDHLYQLHPPSAGIGVAGYHRSTPTTSSWWMGACRASAAYTIIRNAGARSSRAGACTARSRARAVSPKASYGNMCPTGGPDPDILDPARLVDVPTGTYEIGIDPDVPGGPVSRASAAGLPASYLATAAPRFAARLERVRVSRYLVTAADFERFVGATGFVTEAEREGWGWTWEGGWTKRDGSWRRPFGGDADEAYMSARAAMPVLQVSWNDAAAWCAWLSRETGERVRLPLETEWEVFARITGVRSIVEIAPDGPRTVFDTAGDFFAALEGILNRGASSHPSGVVGSPTGRGISRRRSRSRLRRGVQGAARRFAREPPVTAGPRIPLQALSHGTEPFLLLPLRPRLRRGRYSSADNVGHKIAEIAVLNLHGGHQSEFFVLEHAFGHRREQERQHHGIDLSEIPADTEFTARQFRISAIFRLSPAAAVPSASNSALHPWYVVKP